MYPNKYAEIKMPVDSILKPHRKNRKAILGNVNNN
jgi:hypothetical protein